jgi:hypothetical protein
LAVANRESDKEKARVNTDIFARTKALKHYEWSKCKGYYLALSIKEDILRFGIHIKRLWAKCTAKT